MEAEIEPEEITGNIYTIPTHQAIGNLEIHLEFYRSSSESHPSCYEMNIFKYISTAAL
jgi:hypothetical protein